MIEKPRDRDLYKIININGKEFEIRYGYYEEYERERHDPVPILPDFLKDPVYTDEGYPFVTAIQAVCEEFDGTDSELGCFGCKYYKEESEFIGICHNTKLIKK